MKWTGIMELYTSECVSANYIEYCEKKITFLKEHDKSPDLAEQSEEISFSEETEQ
jgi:hypothetical protein